MPTKTFEELKATGSLPTPPGVGMEILRITSNESCSVDELTQCIQSDPSLTARLLQVANSALAGGVRPCSTIKEATMRLGLRAVRSIALGFSLVSAHRVGGCDQFDYGVFWSQSLARAVAAHVMAARFKVGVPAEAFVAALLSDLGSLALATVHPREFGEILAASESATANGRAVMEQSRFGIDHREVTASMLTEWHLPDIFAQAAQQIGAVAPPLDPRKGPGLPALTWIASRFAAAFILPDDKPLDEELVQQALAMFPDWKKVDLPLLWGEIAEGWRKWGNMLEIVTAVVPPYLGGMQTRAHIGCPLFVADRPRTKAQAVAQPVAATAKPQAPVSPSTAPAVQAQPVAQAPAKPVAAGAGTPAPASAGAAGVSSETSSANRARILVVEDDPTSAKLLITLLQRAGHQVAHAAEGTQALRLAMQSLPQVVIADRQMPGMDGLTLCKNLRAFEAGRRIYFISVTAEENEDKIVEAFDAGCDDYVVKPFKPKLLLARVRAGMRVVRLQERVDADKSTMQQQVAELGKKERRLQQAAITDVLTNLPNRRYAMEALKAGWELSQREDAPLSAIMVDIDKFKRVNDTVGHDIGDLVLKETAKVLSTAVEPPNSVCRLGGEEFVVILPGSNGDRAKEVAEQLRIAIEFHPIKGGTFDGRVTASLGVATRRADVANFEQLLKIADEGLYRAKEGGRNQVRFVQAEGPVVAPLEAAAESSAS
jgi:diguanylate cyclase (GGDEF)-like protein